MTTFISKYTGTRNLLINICVAIVFTFIMVSVLALAVNLIANPTLVNSAKF